MRRSATDSRPSSLIGVLSDVDRLQVLAETGLMDSGAEASLDRWAEVTADALGASVALISFVDDRRQLFKSVVGLTGWAAEQGGVPLSHSFCQHTLTTSEPLAIADAREHAVLRTNPAIAELDLVAYAGVAIHVGGQPLGALCVIESIPRAWTAGELALLQRLAAGISAELDLRRAAAEQRRHTRLLASHNRIHEMIAADAPLHTVLAEIVRSIETYDDRLKGSLLLLDAASATFRPGAAPSLPASFMAALDGVAIGPAVGSCGTAAYLGREVITADISTDARWDGYRELVAPLNLRSCWSYPVFGREGVTLGTFGVYGPRPQTPSDAQAVFLRGAAKLAAIALERDDTLNRLQHEASHDPLTQLPNRAALLGRLGHALARRPVPGRGVAVMFCDLDRLKLVNDSLGHDAGDDMLREIACRLAGAVRPADTVGRFGGDEFLVLAEDVAPAEAERIAQRLVDALAAPLPQTPDVTVTCSVGVALATGAHPEVRETVRRADAAMYAAKQAGGNRYRVHDPTTESTSPRRLAIETGLRHAVDRDELDLAFQPIHAFADGAPVALESLLRWTHPTLGMVSPAEFIPIAEQAGLIDDLGHWVLERACRTAVRLRARSGRSLVIGVNVSARQLQRRDFAREVAAVLHDSGLAPEHLVIEVTETALLGADAATDATLRQLTATGVRLFLDDFGTGYSSLAVLKLHPISGIKIDRSFVSGLPASSDDTAIVTALIGMAHGLGLTVVAEGIETPEQHALLEDLDCDFAQGYLLNRPLLSAALDTALDRTAGPLT